MLDSDGSSRWFRTTDQLINSQLLYHWAIEEYLILVPVVGFELTTHALQKRRSTKWAKPANSNFRDLSPEYLFVGCRSWIWTNDL